MRLYSLAASLACLLPAGLPAQTLKQRVAAVAGGTVHLSFAARPGVCGGGMNNINIRDATDEWETDCEHQPVRVSLEVSRGSVVAVRTYVGGRWRPDPAVTDFGTVSAREAAA